MLGTDVRRLLICLVGGLVVTGVACSGSVARKIPASGSAGATGTPGTAGTTTGTGGDTTTAGTAGSTTGAGGDMTATGTAGSTPTMDAGVDAPAATGTGGAGGTGGDTSGTAGSTGAAGTAPPANNALVLTAFPVVVTDSWYPSGWDGDPATVAAFNPNGPPIQITDQTTSATGPCSRRVAAPVGRCFKVTYTPIMSDAGGTRASVALIPNIPMTSMPNFNDATMAPHVPQGATKITAEVAGDVGGEAVTFNLWDANQNDLFTPTFAAGQVWQPLSVSLTGVVYDQEMSPFGWSSMSTTPITFYFDDIQIDNTP